MTRWIAIAAVLGASLLWGCAAPGAGARAPAAAAPASPVEESTVIRMIGDGRFDELRFLEKAAAQGDPIAMYWWSILLRNCVLEACNPDDAGRLLLQSAKAGYLRARADVYQRPGLVTPTGGDVRPLIGAPRESEDKLAWAMGRVANATPGRDPLFDEALTVLDEVSSSDPTMLSLYAAMIWRGPKDRIPVLRAMLLSGTPLLPQVGEELARRYLLTERKRLADVRKMAMAGDEAAASVVCASTGVIEGRPELLPSDVPLCVQALARGQLGLADVMLRHHLTRGETKLAAPYAELCDRIPMRCDALSDYERTRLGATQAWRDRDMVLFLAKGAPYGDLALARLWDAPVVSRQVRRDALARGIRMLENTRPCELRRYDGAQQVFVQVDDCVWGRPVALR
jgi:hypothetical protein